MVRNLRRHRGRVLSSLAGRSTDSRRPEPELFFFTSSELGVGGEGMRRAVDKAAAARGLEVRVVDVEKRPDLASRFRVLVLPALVLARGDHVSARVDGIASESAIAEVVSTEPSRPARAGVTAAGLRDSATTKHSA